MKKISLIILIVFIGFIIAAMTYNFWPSSPVSNSVINTSTPAVTNLPANAPIVNKPTTKPPVNNSTPSSTSKPTPVNATPTLSAAQVATHNQPNDCYLIVNNKVYDVTTYIGRHPGGKKSIYDRCGQESSAIFAAIHSNSAWNLLNKYYVADLSK
jgi:cytochrome b involved in lipid metabolism